MAIHLTENRTDDIDGTPGAETISFGLDGQDWEIDLAGPNADTLRAVMKDWIVHARKRRRPAAPRRSQASRDRSAEIRAWAVHMGYDVSDKGRISNEIKARYNNRLDA